MKAIKKLLSKSKKRSVDVYERFQTIIKNRITNWKNGPKNSKARFALKVLVEIPVTASIIYSILKFSESALMLKLAAIGTISGPVAFFIALTLLGVLVGTVVRRLLGMVVLPSYYKAPEFGIWFTIKNIPNTFYALFSMVVAILAMPVVAIWYASGVFISAINRLIWLVETFVNVPREYFKTRSLECYHMNMNAWRKSWNKEYFYDARSLGDVLERIRRKANAEAQIPTPKNMPKKAAPPKMSRSQRRKHAQNQRVMKVVKPA